MVQSTGVSEGIPPEQVPVDVLTITFAYREDDSPQPAYCLVLDCGLGLCLPTMISYSIEKEVPYGLSRISLHRSLF